MYKINIYMGNLMKTIELKSQTEKMLSMLIKSVKCNNLFKKFYVLVGSLRYSSYI